jgi:hypothetical protein
MCNSAVFSQHLADSASDLQVDLLILQVDLQLSPGLADLQPPPHTHSPCDIQADLIESPVRGPYREIDETFVQKGLEFFVQKRDLIYF